MTARTPAMQALEKAGISFEVLLYNYKSDQHHIGQYAAEAIGELPHRVLKTLMIEVDGQAGCVVLPVDKNLSMKRVAAAFQGKSSQLMKAEKAERFTGYHVGGISPFGQKKRVSVVFDEKVIHEPYVIINGGQRGVLLKLHPQDAVAFLGAKIDGIID